MASALFTFLRLWADELVRPQTLYEHLKNLPADRFATETERPLGLALLDFVISTSPVRAQTLARCLQSQPDWLTQTQPYWHDIPILRQQLAISLAQAASLQQTQPETAMMLYNQALQLMPELAAVWLYRGLLWASLQRWPQALADLSQATSLQPDWLPAWLERLRLLLSLKQLDAALDCVNQALAFLPQESELLLLQGNLYQAQGRLPQAEASYRRALELAPEQAGLWSNLGLVCHLQLRPAEAMRAYQKALELDASLIELWNNLATLQLDQGKLSQAETSLGRCLQLAPQYYPAWVNRGLLAASQGALELAHSYFSQARYLEPKRLESWQHQARLYLDQQQTTEGLSLLEQGIPQVSEPAALLMMLGRNLSLRHQLDQGQQLMQGAIQRSDQAFWLFLKDLGTAEAWFAREPAERQAYLEQLSEVLPRWAERPFAPEIYVQEARFLPLESLWSLVYLHEGPFKELKQALARCFAPAAQRPGIQRRSGPLRLGVVVTPGHEGIFYKLGAALLKALPAACAEVILLGDARKLAESGLRCLSLASGVVAAAQQIHALELDLVYYWETGSDALNYLLPYFQVAPVQFTSWGTTTTTGLDQMHYYLSASGLETPEAQSHYSERLLLSPDLPVCFEDPAPLAAQLSRTELGLPAEGTLYLCLNNPLKLTPEYIRLVLEILSRDSSGQMLLLESRQSWINDSLEPLRQILAPVAERVHWLQAPLPRAKFLNLLALADIGLDTLICSGGHVSHEALAMGLPLVSLAGQSCHSRLTLGRYQQLGLHEGLVEDQRAYVAQALEWSDKPSAREAFKSQLLQRRIALLQRTEPVEQFASLLWQMAQEQGLRATANY